MIMFAYCFRILNRLFGRICQAVESEQRLQADPAALCHSCDRIRERVGIFAQRGLSDRGSRTRAPARQVVESERSPESDCHHSTEREGINVNEREKHVANGSVFTTCSTCSNASNAEGHEIWLLALLLQQQQLQHLVSCGRCSTYVPRK